MFEYGQERVIPHAIQRPLVISWNGNPDQAPFRGDRVPDLKRDDPRNQLPQEVRDAHIKVFDLSDETQLEEYRQVYDAFAKGLAEFSAEERAWVPEKQNWKVFLRWSYRWNEMPEFYRSRVDFSDGRVNFKIPSPPPGPSNA